MSAFITGKEQPLADVFSRHYEFHIPSYQRPYSWEEDHSEALLSDLHAFFEEHDKSEGYFLGSIVLIKSDEAPRADVVDGQQRLTTLTLLLALLAQRLDEDAREHVRAHIVQEGNEVLGLPSNPRLTLRQRDKGFFAHYIQEARLKELMERAPDTLDNEAKQNLRRNAVKLNAMLDERFGGAKQEGLMPFIQFLLQRCFLVTVSTPSQQSAFRVFSVLNSRGMDLAPTDIVKADVIGQIAEPQRDTYSERWEDTEADIGREGFNDLFKHLRTIHVKRHAITFTCRLEAN